MRSVFRLIFLSFKSILKHRKLLRILNKKAVLINAEENRTYLPKKQRTKSMGSLFSWADDRSILPRIFEGGSGAIPSRLSSNSHRKASISAGEDYSILFSDASQKIATERIPGRTIPSVWFETSVFASAIWRKQGHSRVKEPSYDGVTVLTIRNIAAKTPVETNGLFCAHKASIVRYIVTNEKKTPWLKLIRVLSSSTRKWFTDTFHRAGGVHLLILMMMQIIRIWLV